MNKSAIVGPRGRADGSEQVHGGRSRRHCFRGDRRGLAKEEEVRIAGFGTFGTRSPCRAYGQESAHRESVPIPASKSPSFKAAKRLREAVKRGWQEEQAGTGRRPPGRPGSAGAMLEMSDWPGGVEPVWTVLEPESMEALRAEPLADNPTLRLAAGLPDEAFAESAFVRNALIALELIGDAFLAEVHREGAFRARHGCGDARGDDLPGMEATEQYRAGRRCARATCGSFICCMG